MKNSKEKVITQNYRVLFWLCSLKLWYVIQTQKVPKYHHYDSIATLNRVLIIWSRLRRSKRIGVCLCTCVCVCLCHVDDCAPRLGCSSFFYVTPTFVHLILIGCPEKVQLTRHLGPHFTFWKNLFHAEFQSV